MAHIYDPNVVSLEPGRHLFDILDSNIRAETFRRGTTRKYENGSYLIRQGEKANGIHVIKAGTVESLYESGLGRDLILATWEAGDFIGGPYVFGNHEHAWSARALGTVQALHLPHDLLKEFASECAPFALALIECLGYKGERYSKLAQTLATHNTTERVALLLSELARQVLPSEDGRFRVGLISQTKLSQMIGATRQSVGNALQRLESNGVISLEPTCIAITDPTALAQFGKLETE